jgi:hypothetical protein
MRRLIPLLGLLVLFAGCGGGTESAATKARKEFLFKYHDLDDQQLAKICPGFYPTDFLNPKRAKHYHYTKDKKDKLDLTKGVLAQAAKVAPSVPGCKAPGTKPKD